MLALLGGHLILHVSGIRVKVLYSETKFCYCIYLLKNLKITSILNNVFRSQKTLKKTRIKVYNKLSLPVLLYGSET
jgi:hypothetical protein